MAIAPIAGAILLEGGEAAAAAGGIAAAGAAATETTTALGALRAALGGAEGGFGKLLGKVFSLETGLSALKKGFELAVDAIKMAVDFVVTATLAFADFDEKMDALQASSGSTSHEMEVLGDRARELAGSLGFDVSQVVEGLKGLADAGLNADEQMKALVPTLQLAQATGQTVGESVGLMTETLQKFHLDVGQSAEVTDTFAAALRQTALSAPDLATIMGKLSDNAVRSGQSLQGSLASISVLKDVFGDTESAATSFEGMLSALREKSGELGVEVTDSGGKLLPMVDILRNMEKAGFDAAKAGEALGKEAGPTLAALLGVGSDALARLQTEMKGTGEGAKAAEEATDNLRNDLKELNGVSQGIMQQLGAMFEPVARAAVQFVTRIATAVREFIEEHSEAGKFLANLFAGAVTVVGKLIEKFVKFLAPIKAVSEGLKAIAAIGDMVTSGWILLAAKGYELFGKLTKFITDNVAKALGAVKSLLETISHISETPGVSNIPGLSGLTETVGKKAGEWARSIGELQAKIQKSGDELADNFQGKANQALADYIRKTAQATQATSAFQQALRNYKASEDDVAAALAAAGRKKEPPSPTEPGGGVNLGVGVGVGTQVGVNVGVTVPTREQFLFHDQIRAALDAAEASAERAREAFAMLESAPYQEVAERFARFEREAQNASQVFQAQQGILRKLAEEHKEAAQAIGQVADKSAELGRQQRIAGNIAAIAGPLEAVSKASEETARALADLEGSSIVDVGEKYRTFRTSVDKTNEAVKDATEVFGKLSDVQGEVAKATEQLDAATRKVGASQEAGSKIFDKHSKEALAAADALKALATATPDQAPDRVNAFKTAMMELQAAVAAAGNELTRMPPGPEYQQASERLQQMRTDLEELKKAGSELGVNLESSTEKAAATLKGIYRQIVDAFISEFSSALADLFQGSTDGFKNLFDNVGKFFSKMLADMVAEWLKAAIFRQGADATQFGQLIVNLQQNNAAGAGSAALIGAGVGGAVGTAAGADPTVSYIAGAAGAAAGFTIGFQIGGAVGGVWGAFIGGVIGGLVAAAISYKPSERGYADLAAKEGFAVIDAVRVRGKADLVQLQKFSKGVTDAINEIVALSGGSLLSLPKLTLETKKNKWYRVVDAAGITHKFGEDLEAATDFAVIQALKGAQFEGLSPEVQAAFKNTMATTIEELTSDIDFAVAVRDLDLEPTTKDLRDLMKSFTNMRERARALGISLDKVDDAFNQAVEDMKKNILSGLKPFQEAGLTDVEREARRITEAFAEMRENARLFNEELERQKQSRNEEIQGLQDQVAHQQELLAQAQEHPEDFIPPEVLDRLGALGMDPDRILRLATSGIEETIKKLLEEILRLQGLNEGQTPIDTSEIDRAEQAARRALKERVRDSLKPYQRLDLTSVQQQLRELDDTFEKLRRDAHAAGVATHEVDEAYAKAREAIRKQVMEQLQPYLDMAAGLTPLQVQLRELDDRFKELRTNAAELGIDMETVNRAERAAREQLRQQFEDELKAFGGENPFVAQLEDLRKKFEELTKNALALGESTDRVDAAYQQALANLQKQFQDGIQSYLDYGRGLSEVAVRYRDLTRFFDEQREAARALDEAQGFHGGGGPNEQLLDEAQAAAFQQLVDEFKASLQDLRDAGLTPTEIAVRQMRDRFSQLREDAELLGLSVDELSRLELEAIERLRGELDKQLDRYLLSDEEQQQKSLQDEFLGYLRDAFALYTYKPGSQEPLEPEAFPGARELEQTFGDVRKASQELAQTFRDLRFAMQPDGTRDPMNPPAGPGLNGDTQLTPGEIVAEVLDFLEPLREGRGMDGVPAEQQQAIDAASTQVSLLLEQLRLGMTDDVGALQGALGNLVSLLQQSGIDIDGSLLALTQALGSGDIQGFLDDLRDGVLGSTDGFGALIDILLSGGDLSLPDLMHQLASGTFDAIQAMLGLTEIPPELAETLKRIGLAYEAAQNQQHTSRAVERGGRDDANREAEQRQRDLDALLRQLEQFEDLNLSPAERELKKLNEQFDEMRDNAARLGVSLDRVESAYQLAIADFWERLLGPLNDFLESLDLSELSTLTPQQRLDEAQARFQDLATRAMGGDLEAAQQLQAAAQQYLQEAQSFFASGQGYQDIFAMVNAVIQQILGSLAPGLLPTPPIPPPAPTLPDADAFAAMLADTGWGWRDALETAGIPFGTFAGDTYGVDPGEAPAYLGATPDGGPELAVDLSSVREGNRALLEEVRLSRQQEHVDAVELQRRVDEQSEELREVRALLRRLTSTTQYGGRAQ
jgi:TP901 family phage tail tape measure protein